MKLHLSTAAAVVLAFSIAGGPALAQVDAPAPTSPGAPGPTLGAQGELAVDQIVELQTLLAQLGFDPQGIDGVVGPGTRAAISAAQQALGLSVDGEPTLAFLDRLRQEPRAVVAPSAPVPAAG